MFFIIIQILIISNVFNLKLQLNFIEFIQFK